MATHSRVLNYFNGPKKGSAVGLFKHKCKHCDSEISVKGRTTSNLLTHLKVSLSLILFVNLFSTSLSTNIVF